MPLEVVCDSCGSTLYWNMELKSPRDILKIHHGRCNKCGTKLSFDSSFKIEKTKSIIQCSPTIQK